MMKTFKNALLVALLSLSALAPVRAEEFQCEVMSIEGAAFLTNDSASRQPLKEGDLLKTGDTVEVSEKSYVDLAYDKDWQNVTRLEENSKVAIKSIYPTSLEMSQGGIYAKLKALPKESTFEVKTPTAIAAVRGTEYRTVCDEKEGTQVYNFSESQVFVFGQDESGKMNETPMIVENSQVTQIARPGAQPMTPRKMMPEEFQKGSAFKQGIEKRVQENIGKGRFAKVHDMRTIEEAHKVLNAGRRAMVSGLPKDPRIEETIGHENKMLKVMDRAQAAHQEKRESGPPQNNNGMMGQSPDQQKNSGEMRQGQRPEGAPENFNRQGPGQPEQDRPDGFRRDGGRPRKPMQNGEGQPNNNQPQPKNNPPPPRPRQNN